MESLEAAAAAAAGVEVRAIGAEYDGPVDLGSPASLLPYDEDELEVDSGPRSSAGLTSPRNLCDEPDDEEEEEDDIRTIEEGSLKKPILTHSKSNGYAKAGQCSKSTLIDASEKTESSNFLQKPRGSKLGTSSNHRVVKVPPPKVNPLSPDERAKLDAEPDCKIVTYRNFGHTFALDNDLGDGQHNYVARDGTRVMIDNKAPPEDESWLRKLVRITFVIIMYHHFLAGYLGVGLSVYYLLHGGWIARCIVILVLARYLPTYFDRSELNCGKGRIWPWLQNHYLWDLLMEWSNLEVVRTTKLDPARQYLFGIYPHGILILSRGALWGSAFRSLFPGLEFPRTLAASSLFVIPAARELSVWLAAVDARRSSAHKCMESGYNVSVYPGGTAEILTTDPYSNKTTLLARKGFIKLALQYGTPIVPVFVFGEKYAFSRIRLPNKLTAAVLRLTQIPLILFGGIGFSWVPYRVPITVVFGSPIEVKRNPNPTEAEITELHDRFFQAERELYLKYKDQLGYPSNDYLEIVDAKRVTRSDAE